MDKYIFPEIENKIKTITTQTVTSFLKDKIYHISDSEYFIDKLNQLLLDEFIKVSNNFKYIVFSYLFSNDSSGISDGINGYFNIETDGTYSASFIFEKIGCNLTVCCFAL